MCTDKKIILLIIIILISLFANQGCMMVIVSGGRVEREGSEGLLVGDMAVGFVLGYDKDDESQTNFSRGMLIGVGLLLIDVIICNALDSATYGFWGK